MPLQDPRHGEGWNFLEDESDAWYEAFETYETGDGDIHVDVGQYDEFDNMYELVNFVAGTGSYHDTRQFTPCEEDMEMKKREIKNDHWKIPSKLEKIQDMLEKGAMRGEIDLDPNAETAWNITESETRRKDAETKYTAHFTVYNPSNDGSEHLYYALSWYDTPPEETNLEELIDFDIENE